MKLAGFLFFQGHDATMEDRIDERASWATKCEIDERVWGPAQFPLRALAFVDEKYPWEMPLWLCEEINR